jgi:hypothetical protein
VTFTRCGTGAAGPTRIEGSRRVANTAASKAEARAKGREMTIRRKVEHLIHNKDGTISATATGPIRADASGSWEPHAGEPERDDGRVRTL